MENTNIRQLLSDLVMIPSISSLDENQKDVLDSANYIAAVSYTHLTLPTTLVV